MQRIPEPALKGIRRTAIIVLIAAVTIAAVLGILALVTGEFGETQGKVLGTTATIAAFSTLALCHLTQFSRPLRVVGWAGLIASVLAAVPPLVLIWSDWSFFDDTGWLEFWWKSFGVLAILATSLAQANLLLLLIARPQALIRLVLWITIAAIALVAVLLWLPILTDGDVPGGGPAAETYWRFFGLVAILDAVGTIVLPVLGLVLRTPDRVGAGGGPLVVTLPGDLAERVRAAAAGGSVEATAIAAIERGLPTRDPAA